MNANNSDDEVERLEREALERSWAAGKLNPLVGRLYYFVEQNRGEIFRRSGLSPTVVRRGVPPTPEQLRAVVEAVQQLITDRQSIDLRAELRDQMEEIHREIWYHGERNDHDVARIKQEWIRLHAANWRRWLLCEYRFVAERSAEPIFALVAPAADAAGSSENDLAM